MGQTFVEEIAEFINPNDMMLNEPMAKHTTFRTGENVSAYIRIRNKEQLKRLMKCLREKEKEYFVVGNGSNLLVGDKGYSGVIVAIARGYDKIEIDGNTMRVESGAMLSQVAHAAAQASLTGLEFASGIPGTLGGGVMMNCGAYDGEMKQVVRQVTVLKPDGSEAVYTNEELQFGYRTSLIKTSGDIVLDATLTLEPGERDSILARMEELNERRREKQPLEYPSAGSTFKRPEGNFAGKLIMEANLRGYRIGGACVSEKHCGFIINDKGATSADIRQLISYVTDRVKKNTGIVLEPEVIFLGDF